MEKMLLSPQEVSEALGVGRTKVYELINSGDLHRVKIGNCTKIPVGSLRAFLAERGCGEHMLA